MESPSLAKRLRPKTYSIALYLVGIVLIAQVVALVSVFYFRHVVHIDTNPPALPNPPVVQTSSSMPVETVTQNPPERITPVVPNPGRLAVTGTQDVAQRVKALNEEADRFQLQGDLRLAALALFKAESLDPKDPATLVNLARLSVVEKDPDKARVYWQRVVDLGPDTGSIYTTAKEQLALAQGGESSATGSSSFSASGTAGAPKNNAAQRALYVDHIEKTVAPVSGLGSEISLKVVIGSGAIANGIQPGKVDIKLYFYDQQAGGAVVPSKAQLRVNFLGTRQTWANGQQETLLANYQLTSDQARIYNQKYYGYMLRIYYDGKLQDERADPENLLKFFPASK